tara:strand:- start:11063 stop:12187 length:1125 start_codon:yes stop_codon:yes gene_type:complete
MFYEDDLIKSIENNDFSKFQNLIEEKNVNPFCFGMDAIQLCVENNRKNFIEFALKFKDKYNFNPTKFIEKVNKPQYNNILMNILKKYQEEIDFAYNSEIIIKNIIMNKNEELLLYLIKKTTAYPFINEDGVVVKFIIENDMNEALNLIIKDINRSDQLISAAVSGYSYKNYKLLKENFHFKIDYNKLLNAYMYSTLRETEDSLKIINDIIPNISNIEVIEQLKKRRLYFYYDKNSKEISEKQEAFKLLIDHSLKDEESYIHLNNLFYNQVKNNYKNNIKYLLTKSDLLIEEMKKITWKDNIKVLFGKKEKLEYFYTYEDLYYFLKEENKLEDSIFEIFRDKNFTKFVKINKVLNNVESKKLRNLLQISSNINNF